MMVPLLAVQVDVTAAPSGDAIVEGPQHVTVITGPPGPVGPAGTSSLYEQVDANRVAVAQLAQVRLTDNQALALYQQSVTAQFGSAAAVVSGLQTAVANQNSANASQFASMLSSINGNAASIADLYQSAADQNSANASRFTLIEAEIANARGAQPDLLARVTQLDQARVDGDAALSSSVTTVQALANSATASGAVRLVAQAAPAGASALYEWQLVAGSQSVGMRALVTSGGQSEIQFSADKFKIFSGAGAARPVFAIEGSVINLTGDVRVGGSLIVGEVGNSNLPTLPDLIAPAETFAMIYRLKYDSKGRIVDTLPSYRLQGLDTAASALVGQVPYVADQLSPPGGGALRDVFGWLSTSALGRTLMSVADAAAARSVIGAAAAAGGGGHTHAISDITGLQTALDGKAATSHTHAASDVTSGTFADARWPTLVTASASNLIRSIAVDAQGRVTAHTISDRLSQINNLGAPTVGHLPYVSGYSTPNETWSWLASSALGRSVLTAADGAAARSTIGANDAANLSTGTLPNGRLSGGAYTGVTSIAFASTEADKLYLYSNTYGIGIESGTMTFWTGAGGTVRWRFGGTDRTAGTERMTLSAAGTLTAVAFAGSGAALTSINASNLGSGTVPDARLPTLVTAGASSSIRSFAVDAQGRVTAHTLTARLGSLESAATSGLGTMLYVSSYSAPNETWSTLASTATGRSVLTAADATAARSAISAAAASHSHSAADLTSGTLADARLPSLVTAGASNLVRSFSVDAQGRVTAHTISDRLSQIASASGGVVGHIPYISAYSAPNETWGMLATTALGRTLMGVADAAAIRAAAGLGTAATQYIGTSGTAVPLLNAANTWSATQTVLAQITGGFGAAGAAVTSWNDATCARSGSGLNLLTGAASSGPDGSSDYYHSFSFEYVTKDGTGNLTQFAIPYIATAGKVHYRSRYNGTWSDWQSLLTSVDIGTTGGKIPRLNASQNDWSGTQQINPGNTHALVISRGNDGANIYLVRGLDVVGSISTTTTATAYNTSSDYRLKTNYGPIADARTRLLAIPVYRGEFLAEPGVLVDYFIAHELAAHLPQAVTGAKDAVNDNGHPIYQGVDQSKLVPLHHAAMQRLFTEHDQLVERISELEARVAALEAA